MLEKIANGTFGRLFAFEDHNLDFWRQEGEWQTGTNIGWICFFMLGDFFDRLTCFDFFRPLMSASKKGLKLEVRFVSELTDNDFALNAAPADIERLCNNQLPSFNRSFRDFDQAFQFYSDDFDRNLSLLKIDTGDQLCELVIGDQHVELLDT